METSSVPSRSHRKPARKRREPPRPLIINEELFRGVWIKERKRADRLNQPLVLLIVALKNPANAHSTSIWVPVIEALATITRETDVLGWFEGRMAIGVILPEIHDIEAVRMSELEARFSRELDKRSDPDTPGRLSIRLHIHSDPKRTAAGAHSPTGSSDFPEPDSRQERATIYDG